MAARKYLVKLKIAEPFYVEADGIFGANHGFLLLTKSISGVVAAFPRESVEYVVEASLENTVASAHAGWKESTRPRENDR